MGMIHNAALLALGLAFCFSAHAEESSGRTADGCTYRVVNGQYLTSCADAHGKRSVTAPEPRAETGPVTDYGSVPVRHNSYAPAPTRANPAPYSGPVSSIERENAPVLHNDLPDFETENLRSHRLNQTYVGALLGANNLTQSNASATTGFGITLGTELDDTFGIELGYSYGKQNFQMGLASRGSSNAAFQTAAPIGYVAPNDASLSSSLLTAELKTHLTNPGRRLRPFLGAGLGWRSATLTETVDPFSGLSGGSLHQNTLGGLASVGTTLRVAAALDLAFSFRYYFPLFHPDAQLQQPSASSNLVSNQSALTQDDNLLTGSTQYQVLGGLQYSF